MELKKKCGSTAYLVGVTGALDMTGAVRRLFRLLMYVRAIA